MARIGENTGNQYSGRSTKIGTFTNIGKRTSFGTFTGVPIVQFQFQYILHFLITWTQCNAIQVIKVKNILVGERLKRNAPNYQAFKQQEQHIDWHLYYFSLIPYLSVPIAGIFTDFGICTNTGTENVRYRYRYRYRVTGWEIERAPVPIPKYRLGNWESPSTDTEIPVLLGLLIPISACETWKCNTILNWSELWDNWSWKIICFISMSRNHLWYLFQKKVKRWDWQVLRAEFANFRYWPEKQCSNASSGQTNRSSRWRLGFFQEKESGIIWWHQFYL